MPNQPLSLATTLEPFSEAISEIKWRDGNIVSLVIQRSKVSRVLADKWDSLILTLGAYGIARHYI